ncbi:ATP-binding protein [Pedobacter aquatilis]|uniref:ATP-binding protein n=1 Tax=Pedobacter aquatilis TaxID=351343 RepID=UPI00292F5B23|nr:ATP-binding protein [Pedobacter aquatilis]
MIENTFGKDIIPQNDTERLEALHRYKVMDSPPEDCFDNLARLAREIFSVPIALISLVDADRVYFKSNMGMGNAKEANRGKSLCALAVLDPLVTVYEDALKEPCLAANPNVAGAFGLRFYAGAPLVTSDGFLIGTFCVIDRQAREFSVLEREMLEKLAQAVMDLIELRYAALLDRSQHETENMEHASYSEKLQAINEEMSAANEELARSRDSLGEANSNLEQILNMLPASVVIIRGYDLIVEMINNSNLDYWKKTKEEVLGKPFLEILPDLADQPFASQLRHVMSTGAIIDVKESPVLFDAGNGKIRETYVDYTYQPLSDLSGERTGVLVMSFEITDRVLAKRQLENYAHELATINEKLKITNDDLFKSQQRFKFLIQEAPVAIGVLHGNRLIVETANAKLLEVWGKQAVILGLPLADALPEIADQPFLGILADVYHSGNPFFANEIRAMLEHNGELKEIFFNLVYQPVKGISGLVSDILIVAVDVTQQVNSRLRVERAELETRLAVEGANVGTWSIDTRTMDIVASPRLKELFGFHGDATVSVSDLVETIDPEFRPSAVAQMEEVIATGGSYDISYLVNGAMDGNKRWLRAFGRMNGEKGQEPDIFSGVVMDITDQRQDEIRKNDFIGMVSHELKTPLTSLNGYLQLLQRKVEKEQQLSVEMFAQPLKQAKHMADLINGFLNVSRLDAGKIHIEKSVFDLTSLTAEIYRENVPLFNSHNILFKGNDKLLVIGDSNKIGQVVNNLVSNAAKYSKSGCTITITCALKDAVALVSIADQGIGIQSHDLEKLFERYYRVEENTNVSGFGIGLYLCSEIINRHGGKIWAESEPGKGSVFHFELPLAD